MCYSGRCIWEDFMGNCRFPIHVKEVIEKYKYPNCGMDVQSPEEQEYVNEIDKDIKAILERNKSK